MATKSSCLCKHEFPLRDPPEPWLYAQNHDITWINYHIIGPHLIKGITAYQAVKGDKGTFLTYQHRYGGIATVTCSKANPERELCSPAKVDRSWFAQLKSCNLAAGEEEASGLPSHAKSTPTELNCYNPHSGHFLPRIRASAIRDKNHPGQKLRLNSSASRLSLGVPFPVKWRTKTNQDSLCLVTV